MQPHDIAARIIAGGMLSEEEIYALAEVRTADERKALRDAAAEVTTALCSRDFDFCSIVNARSGLCPEDCKWCAQSGRYTTGCQTYAMADPEECMTLARANHDGGVGRFSLVASGRRVTGKSLRQMCQVMQDVRRRVGINTCASLGLLDRDDLLTLWEAGVRRYHCNLEAAPSFFPTLCTTHTIDDKLRTIRLAREIGFEICSGGIIGMGETPRQRAELAITLRQAQPVSIPINILCPIPGTPLADMLPISEDDIIDTVAIFRLTHPRVQLRFAGGRQRLSRQAQLEAIRAGINGAIVGDLLTTVGSTVARDRDMVREAGYNV